jgi:hypothetical protein
LNFEEFRVRQTKHTNHTLASIKMFEYLLFSAIGSVGTFLVLEIGWHHDIQIVKSENSNQYDIKI